MTFTISNQHLKSDLIHPLPQMLIKYSILMERFFKPIQIAVSRFRKDVFDNIEVIAVIRINHHGTIRTDSLAYRADNRYVPTIASFQWHAHCTTSYLYFECTMSALITLSGMMSDQFSRRVIVTQVQIINVERGVIA